MIPAPMSTVAVVMPVFNGERFLRPAIESVLSQSFPDLRFLIVDDGSTDNSVKTIKSYQDRRITLLENARNQGIANSLNRAIGLVDEEFVARMDCDDICHLDRLQRQLRFMRRNEIIGICGTGYRTIGAEKSQKFRGPRDSEVIRASMLFRNPIAHPTVMMRTRFLTENHLAYDSDQESNEDYDLWQRASEYFPLANIPDILLDYRISQEGVSLRFRERSLEEAGQVLGKAYTRGLGWLDIFPTEEELRLHFEIANIRFVNANKLPEYEAWLCRLGRQNQKIQRFDAKVFNRMIQGRWFEVCYAAAAGQSRAVRSYFSSNLRKGLLSPSEGKLVLKRLLNSRRRPGLQA